MTTAHSHHQHADSLLVTPHLRDFGDGIFSLDSGYFRSEFDAIHFVVEKNRVAIIDTSTQYAVPRVMESLAALDLTPENVDWILLSHVHLDHAGGAGELMRRCPNARVTVHPRGTRHLVDPSQLWAAVCEVYGSEMAKREYGGLEPIDRARIHETPEGSFIDLAGRRIDFWESPGHAKHHVYIRDSKTNSFFTGDTFGISYREFDNQNGAFIFITSSPSQFSPEEHKASIQRLMDANPPAVYLTHFAQVQDVQRHGQTLIRQVDHYAQIALRHRSAGAQRAALIRADLTQLMLDQLHQHGVSLTDAQCLQILDLDLQLNSDGLVCWLDTLKS
jgi:glyoxylase-like metal-dependent hydrolase (beta-lactamase superfamily II)